MESERDDDLQNHGDEIESANEAESGFDEFEVGEDTPQPEASEEATESLRDLVTYLVQNLVDEPDEVEISVERRGPAVHIQLRLPGGELGKVIGRGGRIAKAIRTVLLIAGSKHHLRVSLDIES